MTKEEIESERLKLSEWYAEQTRIFNEKNWLLDQEKEKYPEERTLDTKSLATEYAKIESPVAEVKVATTEVIK